MPSIPCTWVGHAWGDCSRILICPGPGSPRLVDAEQTLELFIRVPARSVPPGRLRVAPQRPPGVTAMAPPQQTAHRTTTPGSLPPQGPRKRLN